MHHLARSPARQGHPAGGDGGSDSDDTPPFPIYRSSRSTSSHHHNLLSCFLIDTASPQPRKHQNASDIPPHPRSPVDRRCRCRWRCGWVAVCNALDVFGSVRFVECHRLIYPAVFLKSLLLHGPLLRSLPAPSRWSAGATQCSERHSSCRTVCILDIRACFLIMSLFGNRV